MDEAVLNQTKAAWKAARFEWLRALCLKAEADGDFVEDNSFAIGEHAERDYLSCFALEIEGAVNEVKPAVDTLADKLLAA